MERRFKDVVKTLLPLSRKKKENLNWISGYIHGHDLNEVKYWLKQDMLRIDTGSIGTRTLSCKTDYPVLIPHGDAKDDPELINMCDVWNKSLQKLIKQEVYEKFSQNAGNKIVGLVAPNIIGLDEIKEAAALQLFADEKVHVLLLGDPGTGKTDILRSIADMAPISSFGLGSGTSGAGLTVTVRGNEVIKGLLPLANRGICCIDELNLMKERDRAGLLNAMEKGFVSYDKANKHVQLKADCNILGTANPKGDRFAGWIVETLKKQLPFDPALLSRFHIVFLLRRPDVDKFVKITKKIVSEEKTKVTEEDYEFIKEYIKFVRDIKPDFDKEMEKMITAFIEEIKVDEKKYLIEISPRLVLGIMRMARASARMHMRDKVSKADLHKVLWLLRNALEVKKKKETSTK